MAKDRLQPNTRVAVTGRRGAAQLPGHLESFTVEAAETLGTSSVVAAAGDVAPALTVASDVSTLFMVVNICK